MQEDKWPRVPRQFLEEVASYRTNRAVITLRDGRQMREVNVVNGRIIGVGRSPEITFDPKDIINVTEQPWPELPRRFHELVAAFPETSYGASRVTVTLKSGRKIRGVVIAWGRQIVKVGDTVVKDAEDLSFDPSEVIDVQQQP